MNESAIHNPVLLQDLKPAFGQIVRQYPEATNEFLRFQVGVNVDRPLMEGIFEGKRLVGEFATGRTFSSFKLLGWGATLQAAQRMASKKTKSSPILSASCQNGKVLDMGSYPMGRSAN